MRFSLPVAEKFTEISLSNVKTESSSFSSPTKNGSETSSWGPIRTPESVSSVGRKEAVSSSSPVSVSSKPHLSDYSKVEILLNDGLGGNSSVIDTGLSEEEKEQIRLSQIGRKKDFVHIERIDGRTMNVIQGLELHTRVFNSEEQKKIVECVYNLQRMGQKGMLRGIQWNLAFVIFNSIQWSAIFKVWNCSVSIEPRVISLSWSHN